MSKFFTLCFGHSVAAATRAVVLVSGAHWLLVAVPAPKHEAGHALAIPLRHQSQADSEAFALARTGLLA